MKKLKILEKVFYSTLLLISKSISKIPTSPCATDTNQTLIQFPLKNSSEINQNLEIKCPQNHTQIRLHIWFRVADPPSPENKTTLLSLNDDIKIQIYQEDEEIYLRVWNKFSGVNAVEKIEDLKLWCFFWLEKNGENMEYALRQGKDYFNSKYSKKILLNGKKSLIIFNRRKYEKLHYWGEKSNFDKNGGIQRTDFFWRDKSLGLFMRNN